MTVVLSCGALVVATAIGLFGTAAVGVAREKAGLDDTPQRKTALVLFGVLVASFAALIVFIFLATAGVI
jgi:hypothetical protein